MLDALCKNTLVPLILRAGLAVIFIYHGLQLASADNEWGAAWATNAAKNKNEPVAEPLQSSVTQMAVAWGQLIGGIAMALGFLTRLAALGLAVIMVGAVRIVHWPNGFPLLKGNEYNGGYEYNFAIIVMCAAVFLLGGGTLAVDRIWRVRRRPLAT
jgi:putative oxidoreductase